MNEQKFNSGLDIVFLAACALHGRVPTAEEMSSVDFEWLYKQASRHSMQSITYFALKSYYEKNGALPQGLTEEQYLQFEKDYKKQVQRTVYFSFEREKIIAFLESSGIWYLPMKGIILQNHYPQLGMRQMADNDIYFDISRRKDVKSFMSDSGYEVVAYGQGVHDTYQKQPFYNFEMHVYLYRESTNDTFYEYYKNVKERLVKDEGNSFGYHFSDEDFYIHTLTHIYKHYSHGGLGVRFLMDVFVYLQSKEATLDWDYISAELEKLKIFDFAQTVKSLSKKLFSNECICFRNKTELLSKEELQELEYYINSGIYGTKENAVNSSLKKLTGSEEKNAKGKFKYILSRLFPNMLYYKENYPFLYKTKIFIPFFVVYRIIVKGFSARKTASQEIKVLNKKK